MEIDELMKKYGVATPEELDRKLAEIERAATEQKKQIENLERIKSDQGNQIGDLRKKVDEYNLKLAEKKEAAVVENVKDEKLYEKECDEVEASLSDAELDVLEEAFKGLDPKVRKLVERPGEGRLAFIKEVLDTAEAPTQETFRRPVKKKPLSVSEQIKEALASRNGVKTAPRFQSSGVPAASAKPKQVSVPPSVTRGGSVLDLISYQKTNGG